MSNLPAWPDDQYDRRRVRALADAVALGCLWVDLLGHVDERTVERLVLPRTPCGVIFTAPDDVTWTDAAADKLVGRTFGRRWVGLDHLPPGLADALAAALLRSMQLREVA